MALVTLNLDDASVAQVVMDVPLGVGWTEDRASRVIVAKCGALEVVLLVGDEAALNVAMHLTADPPPAVTE